MRFNRGLAPTLALALIGWCVAAAPALAEPANGYVATIVDGLRQAGFSEIRVERTLLNRERVVAARPDLLREIVVDPRTGEILRDYSRQRIVLVPAEGNRDILDHDTEPGPERPEELGDEAAERADHDADGGADGSEPSD